MRVILASKHRKETAEAVLLNWAVGLRIAAAAILKQSRYSAGLLQRLPACPLNKAGREREGEKVVIGSSSLPMWQLQRTRLPSFFESVRSFSGRAIRERRKIPNEGGFSSVSPTTGGGKLVLEMVAVEGSGCGTLDSLDPSQGLLHPIPDVLSSVLRPWIS